MQPINKIILSSLIASTFLLGKDMIYSVPDSSNFTNSIGMKFKSIPAGTFVMGTPTPNCPKDNPFTEKNEFDECLGSISKSETPAYRASVKSFYMGETEVTQGQWYEIMGNNPAKFKTGDANMPVEQVSWDDAKEFISRLNQKEGTNKYRLPTEEEWEYAARAGTTTKWYCGDSEACVNSIAVYDTNSPKPVKSKKPNAFGLYDMSGNVWEWTDSCYTEDYNKGCYKNYKVSRGGSWDYGAVYTRSAIRNNYAPGDRGSSLGFRLLRTK
jgi:formylglycine-generating enzyme required for sulfatase activity